MSCLIPSVDELVSIFTILNTVWSENWCLDTLRNVALDETIYAYEPRMDHRKRSDHNKEKAIEAKGLALNQWIKENVGLSPVVHIESKPHDGLFSSGLATKSTKTNLPYILSLIPYLGETVKIETIIMNFAQLCS